MQTIEKGIVRIFDDSGRPVGAGVLVDTHLVVTCAHVVIRSLNMNHEKPNRPSQAIYLDFPFLAPDTKLIGHVESWLPLQKDGSGDFAYIKIIGKMPIDSKPLPILETEALHNHSIRTLGFPTNYPAGTWSDGIIKGQVATGRWEVEDNTNFGHFIEPGFSGAPIWDNELDCVVGIVAASDSVQQRRLAHLIPVKDFLKIMPGEAFEKPKVTIPDTDLISRLLENIVMTISKLLPPLTRKSGPNAYFKNLITLIATAIVFGIIFSVLEDQISSNVIIQGFAAKEDGTVTPNLLVVAFVDQQEVERDYSTSSKWDGSEPDSLALKSGKNFTLSIPNTLGYPVDWFDWAVFIPADLLRVGESRYMQTPSGKQLVLVALDINAISFDPMQPLYLGQDRVVFPKSDLPLSASQPMNSKNINTPLRHFFQVFFVVLLGLVSNIVSSYLQSEWNLLKDKKRITVVMVVMLISAIFIYYLG